MNRRFFIGLTICLIVIMGCSFGIKARGASKTMPDISNDYYKEIEKAYLEQVKDKLDENGFCNAGVTLTKVLDESGTFDYTLSVHHRRIDRMDECQREQISAIIVCDGVAVENSTVSVRYIEY